jgi:hypothetical protein
MALPKSFEKKAPIVAHGRILCLNVAEGMGLKETFSAYKVMVVNLKKIDDTQLLFGKMG